MERTRKTRQHAYCAIRAIKLQKLKGGGEFFSNNGKFPIDGGDAVMISFLTSKERNLFRLWDSSAAKW